MPQKQQTEVETRQFARVFVDAPGSIPPEAEAFKSERGYYYRLNLQGLHPDDASGLVEKAHRNFEVELVAQVVEDGTITKERRYVDSVAEVPEGYQAQRGPQGGVYYETNPLQDPVEQATLRDGVTDDLGYSDQPVLAIQFEDIEEGDRIAFEPPDADGQRDMGVVRDIDEDNRMVTVESGDGLTDVAAAPLTDVEEKEDGGVTSDTAGAHNAVYGGQSLPDECRSCGERERQEGSFYCDECEPGVSKDCEGHHVGPEMAEGYRLEGNEVLCEPSDEVYDINADIEGNMGECPGCGEDLSHVIKSIRKEGEEVWVYYYGPEGGTGWQSMATGEVRYQAARPGAAPEDPMVEGDFASGWDAAPESHDELIPGQRIEFEDLSGGSGYIEGVVSHVEDDGTAVVDVPEKDITGFKIPESGENADNAVITAVEEDPDVDLDALDHEVGEEVHLRTDHYAQDHPDYMDEEGVISDIKYHNGQPLYDFAESEDGVVIDQFYEDELENLMVDDQDEMVNVQEEFDLVDNDIGPWEYLEEGDEIYYQSSTSDEWDEAEIVNVDPDMDVVQTDDDKMMWTGTPMLVEDDVAERIEDTLGGSDAGYTPEVGDELDHPDFPGTITIEEINDEGEPIAQDEDGYDYNLALGTFDDLTEDMVVSGGSDDMGWETEFDPESLEEGDYVQTAIGDSEYEGPIVETDGEDIWVDAESTEGNAPFTIDEVEAVADSETSAGGSDSGMTGEDVIEHLEGGPEDGVYFEIPDNYDGEGVGEATAYVGGDILYETEEGEEHWIGEEQVAENAVSVGEPPGESSGGTEGPAAGDFEGYDAGNINPDANDWEPLDSVDETTVSEGDTVALVADYDHFDDKTMYVGSAQQADDGSWDIDAINHDESDYNLSEPVNDNDVEAYVASEGPTDLLEGTGFDLGDQIEYQGIVGEITGTTSLMTDGEPSHVTADIDGHEVTIHPNSLEAPEGAEEDAEASEQQEVSDDAVGQGVESEATGGAGSGLWEGAGLSSYTPDDIAETYGMGKVNATTGNTIASKQVVEFSDGTEAVYTDTNHPKADKGLGDRAVTSSQFVRALFEDYDEHGVPEIDGDPQAGYFFSGAAPGKDVTEAPDEYTSKVDPDDFYRQAAYQVMLGNNDAHVNNVKVDEDGNLHWFDMDHAGGSIHKESALNKSYKYQDGWDRIFGELARTGTELGFGTKDEVRTQIFEKALEVAPEIDNQALEEAQKAASGYNTEFVSNMVQNIKDLKNGNYPYKP